MRTLFAGSRRSVAAQDLKPIRVHLPDIVLLASLNPGRERMTDILQRGGNLELLPSGANPASRESWMAVPVDEIMMVVPPPHISPADKRTERQRYPVQMKVGDWEISGTAFLKPGAEQDAMLRVTQPFLPLTAVTMTTSGGAVVESHEVVIVNLRYAEFMTD